MKGIRQSAAVLTLSLISAFALFETPAFANNLISNGSFENPVVNPASQCGPYADCFGYHNATPGNDFVGAWLLLPNAPIPSGYAAVMVTGYSYQETNNDTGAALYFHPEDGLQALDLTGEGNQGDWNGVKQTVTTIAGQKYDLSFYLGHQYGLAPGYTNSPAALNLFINGQPIGRFTNSANLNVNDVTWALENYVFVADSGSTTIAFQNATAYSNNYAGLDNVSLTPVPEPATLLLLGTGIIGILSTLRLRRR